MPLQPAIAARTPDAPAALGLERAAALDILAPVSGVIVPLDAVPDPVFARRMVGDGVAIDPTTPDVLAPMAGRVTQFHPAHHAVAITSDGGVEVLIHVGLDTVSLRGRGFKALAAVGDRVERGQPLLVFDPEVIAGEGHSLLTPVVVTSGDRVKALRRAHGFADAGQTLLLRVDAAPAMAETVAVAGGETAISDAVMLPNEEGLHARPAAVLANEARRFRASIRLVRDADEADARSLVAIVGLSTRKGDVVRVRAVGLDAREAAAALSDLLRRGCGEQPGEAPRVARAPSLPEQGAAEPGEIRGVPAAPGIAIGRVVQQRHGEIRVQETGGTLQAERVRLSRAIAAGAAQLSALRQQASGTAARILDVHLALLQDPELADLAEAPLRAGKSAAFAWREAFTSHAARLEQARSALARERAADVRDAGLRVLALLAGTESKLALPADAVLIAEALDPSRIAALDRSRLRGICTTGGSPTGHAAIVARSLGIPAICGIDPAALSVADGAQVVIDGTRGSLRTSPGEGQLEEARRQMESQAARVESERAAASSLARTKDGHRVEVAANIAGLDDARAAVAAGAEGVGLLRTEFLLHGECAPTEDEQAAAYRGIAESLGRGRRLVIRTLDAGADKPVAWLPLPAEANPFLGLRGIRVGLDRPALLRTQLRAILRAAPFGDVYVMFPMVTDVEEVRAARAMLAEEQAAIPNQVKVGVMVEVPSAALLAERLAREVDFLSIGTNDLTQYTLAMDRGHPRLAQRADALHPAVLRLIAMTVEGAHRHGRWAGVCGGIASDPLAAPVLVGLGVDELSVPAPALGPVKAALARWTLGECKGLAAEALNFATAAEVRGALAARREGA